jgi:hypothetical protein
MDYSVFLVFMTGSLIVYGLMFWMWIEKWVSLELILGVVTIKFIITVGWAYGLKAKKLLDKHKRQPPPDEQP